MNLNPSSQFRSAQSATLKVGFVPLADCAPLMMAQELGLFKKFGLRVILSRELGWATIRDKIVHRELDAAHALAAMPMAATLGLGSIPTECLTALVLNLGGNAITLSNDLWHAGVRDGVTLREQIKRLRHEKVYTFGVTFPFSSHRHLLRRWFASHGIDADRDVRIVVVPPPQMAANLRAGNLDGFCAGEPWNSVAVQARAGWIVSASAESDAGHPEKVLMVRSDFARKYAEQHVALVAALQEACAWCDRPENRDHLLATLAQPEYVGVPETVLRHGIAGEMDFGHGIQRAVPGFCTFHRGNANEPSNDKAAWTLELIRESGLCDQPSALNFAFGCRVFRTDIFEQAVRLCSSTHTKTENETDPEKQTVLV
jgi:ABC-type nitrate/sulfonate/bicarbonate transport system substrate-binding protein